MEPPKPKKQKKTAPQKKKAKIEEEPSYVIFLRDDWNPETSHKIPAGKSMLIGRSRNFGIRDKRLSKRQLDILQPSIHDDFIVVTQHGINPSFFQRAGGTCEVFSAQSEVVLSNGDVLNLLGNIYPFSVVVKPREPATQGDNYCFYQNTVESRPSGDLIDVIHKEWLTNFELLESHHGYIQWLFPLFESNGMNYQSKKLRKEEAQLIRKDLTCAKRVITSYKMMLGFYGIELVDEQTGVLKRAKNWKERYENLKTHFHNFLRITRILTSLGHLGFVRYKQPLLDFLHHEIFNTKKLAICEEAYTTFWVKTVVYDQAYVEKTKELPEDREESVFFHSNNNNNNNK